MIVRVVRELFHRYKKHPTSNLTKRKHASDKQEYTLVKMRVLELKGALAKLQGEIIHQAFWSALSKCSPSRILAGLGDVYLLAATLRPETMYGQVIAGCLRVAETLCLF